MIVSVAKATVFMCTIAIPLSCIPHRITETAIHSVSDQLFTMSSSLSTWYIIISSLGIYHSSSPVVETKLGSVQGIVSASRDGREFYEYRNIPFAKPPVEELRFEAPLPPEPWKGVRDASRWSSACLQFDALVRGTIVGEEDCLYLNVFTPNLKPEKPMPVIAYIHGGGFTGGESKQFDPKYFMDYDVVVVTFNYRLASLGFLNTGDELIRGNMGLKDQNMALRWIQDNVNFFGGDENHVTLFGESAGGASVHYHVISPLSRGLFHRAMMQSGNVACPWAFTRNPRNQAIKYGKIVGCPTDNTTVLVKCLKEMDGKEIVKHHVKIMSPVHTQDDFFPGSVEAVIRNDTFLSENPFDMLERGDFARIPVIFGVNSGEGGLKTARLESYHRILDELDEKWNVHVPVLMHYDPNRTDISDRLREHYIPENRVNNETEIPSQADNATRPLDEIQEDESTSQNLTKIVTRANPADHLISLTRMLSDGLFFEPNHRVVKYHSKFVPTYAYYYTYVSDSLPAVYALIRAARPKRWYPWEVNIAGGVVLYYADKYIWRSKDPKRFGACHGDDILQLWSFSLITDIRPSSGDYPFSRDFVHSVVSFAKRKKLKFGNESWPSVDPTNETLTYMNLDRHPHLMEEPFMQGVKFIESLNIRDPHEKNNW